MSQQFLRFVVNAALLFFCVASICGCSLIGFGIGSAIDGGKADIDTLQVDVATTLDDGDKIRIVLSDSTVIEGVYKSTGHSDSIQYARRYEAFLESWKGEASFPKLGETLFLHTKSGRLPSEYSFRGFGMQTLNLNVKAADTLAVVLFPLSRLTALENEQGTMLDLSTLQRMNKAGQLPRDVSLHVATNQNFSQVPVDDILYVEKENTKNAKWTGGAIGLLIDVALAVAISNIDFFGGGFVLGK